MVLEPERSNWTIHLPNLFEFHLPFPLFSGNILKTIVIDTFNQNKNVGIVFRDFIESDKFRCSVDIANLIDRGYIGPIFIPKLYPLNIINNLKLTSTLNSFWILIKNLLCNIDLEKANWRNYCLQRCISLPKVPAFFGCKDLIPIEYYDFKTKIKIEFLLIICYLLNGQLSITNFNQNFDIITDPNFYHYSYYWMNLPFMEYERVFYFKNRMYFSRRFFGFSENSTNNYKHEIYCFKITKPFTNEKGLGQIENVWKMNTHDEMNKPLDLHRAVYQDFWVAHINSSYLINHMLFANLEKLVILQERIWLDDRKTDEKPENFSKFVFDLGKIMRNVYNDYNFTFKISGIKTDNTANESYLNVSIIIDTMQEDIFEFFLFLNDLFIPDVVFNVIFVNSPGYTSPNDAFVKYRFNKKYFFKLCLDDDNDLETILVYPRRKNSSEGHKLYSFSASPFYIKEDFPYNFYRISDFEFFGYNLEYHQEKNISLGVLIVVQGNYIHRINIHKHQTIKVISRNLSKTSNLVFEKHLVAYNKFSSANMSLIINLEVSEKGFEILATLSVIWVIIAGVASFIFFATVFYILFAKCAGRKKNREFKRLKT